MHNTIRECYSELLFGLPSPHFAYVKNISPGLPLFLFNYSDRKLYAIFEAASHGQMNIDAYGWTGDGAKYSPYPAQGWSNTNSSVIGNANTSHPQKTWRSLFQNSTTSQTTKEDQDLGAQAPESNFPQSDQSNMECDSLSVPPWLEGEILNYEAPPEDSSMWNYEEVQAGSVPVLVSPAF
ncbi:hypothetical protein RHSIM_Rhsim07G0217400 [Rhododendron simsii]|uniref:DCD domain-containing protein n=1 Tax=Rhododendron simsii TaxID=118357 RepID=A0A834GT45_RHOSS|nr:hypothetical protein RHSIM_Rhsim07G0217400 [Rhododendron simsii]